MLLNRPIQNTRIALGLALSTLLWSSLTSQAQVTFTQITNSPIVTDQGNWVACAWGDFRNTGLLDLFVCNAQPGTNAFYQNNHDGTFTKVEKGAALEDSDYHVGVTVGDYDNDGALDFAVTSGVGSPTPGRVTVFHNEGNATFTNASSGPLAEASGQFGPVVWADVDNDGWLDLFVANRGLGGDGGTNLLFHNNGDGSFSAITTGALVSDAGDGYCVAWADYDGDGRPDLLVLNNNNASASKNFLYHNEGGGKFTKVTTNLIATDSWPQGAACAAWGDYDNDGLPDLFITDEAGTANRLYHNSGAGVFTRVASGPELATSGGAANGCAWGDYDNDGYLDLFVSGDGQKNALFHNNGDGSFTQVKTGSVVNGSGPVSVCGAVSWVDYDNDGFLDLFVGQYTSDYSHSFAPASNLLYHNNGNSNGWLEVRLLGTVGNRSAIGAKVRLHATIGGKTFWQMREINDGSGYNCPPLVAHFGLGDATNVDLLRIEWPSGAVQQFSNTPPKQILTIAEPPLLLATLSNGLPQFALKGGFGLLYEVQSSADLVTWSTLGSLAISSPNGAVSILDTNAPGVARFYRAVSVPAPVVTNLIFVQPGAFKMGAPTNEVDSGPGEHPQTTVTISHGFWIGKYLVTQGEYQAVAGSNPSYFTSANGFSEDLTRPVENLTWYDATNYCALRTKQEQAEGLIASNLIYRLPTEAEWEYAARAGTTTRFSYGDDPDYTNLVNYSWYDANSGGMSQPVGQKPPNPWGLYDVHGNVYEWCLDWYGAYPGGTAVDPRGVSTEWRGARGGGLANDAPQCRSANRFYVSPILVEDDLGFRIVLAQSE